MFTSTLLAALPLLPLCVSGAPAPAYPSSGSSSSVVNQTTCNGKTYTYNGLAGYGFIPGNARDQYGDTIGGIGSSAAISPNTWRRAPNGSYTGVLYAQPDRGWNTNGTLNYQARVHRFSVVLTPNTSASVSDPSPPNLRFYYLDSTLYTDPAGNPTTGLDGDFSGHASFGPDIPDVPVATYTGDGFGGAGPGGKRVPVDAEGLVYNAADGSFFVSDEYGPYIYRFSRDGRMQAAIRPPDAFVPQRNGTESFSADSPPLYDPSHAPVPADPTQGRSNNQGFEGMGISPDGKILTVLLQSALVQDGGSSKSTNFNARLLRYDLSASKTGNHPTLVAEYVVPLPTYIRADGKARTAAQSEIHDVGGNGGQFLVLARDSGAGRAADSTTSLYRHVDVFDVSNATNLVGAATAADNAVNGSVASSKGKLQAGIVPAAYCSFLDYNVNAELARFGLHNGGVDDPTLLNEKWESLLVVPQLDAAGQKVPGKWFVISLSDDDFITQDGYMNFGKYPYKDASGASLDNQALVFDVTFPNGTQPWQGY